MAIATATLPEDLVIEIMVWLSVKSLKRFRCLSKSLCAFIDSPDFIKSHHYNSPNNSNRKLISPSLNNFHVSDVNLDLEDDILRLGKPVSYSLWNNNMEIRGYCNGLLLFSKKSPMLYDDSLHFSLWNPSTGQYRDLPSHCSEFHNRFSSWDEIGCGLIYDDSTDEYKVIFLLLSRKVTSSTYITSEFQVWIYELKSNIWRMIGTPSFPQIEYARNKNFRDEGFTGISHFTDGILYMSYGNYRWGIEIVAFDVRTETFSFMPQPVCSFSLEETETKLHLLEGCLCISYLSSPGSPLQAAELYIRKKDIGVADVFNWTKLFSFVGSLFSDIIWPDCTMNVLGYLKRSRDKITFGVGMHMFSYDVKAKSFAKVEVDHIDCRSHTPILCLLESLVSLDVGANFK